MLSKKEKAYLQSVATGLQAFIDSNGTAVPKAVEEFKKEDPTERDEFVGLGKGTREFIVEARKIFGTAKISFNDSKIKDLAWKHRIGHLGALLLKQQKRGFWHLEIEDRNGRQFVTHFNFTKV